MFLHLSLAGMPRKGGAMRGDAIKVGGSLWPSVMAICYSLLLWPSVVAFWHGLLLLPSGWKWSSVMDFWCGLLFWPSGMTFCYGLLVERQSLSREQVSARKDTPLLWKNGWYTSYLNSFLLVCLFYFLSFGLNGITRQKRDKIPWNTETLSLQSKKYAKHLWKQSTNPTSQRYFHSW